MTPGTGDTLKKVRSGQALVIPASTYNAFIDAALDFRQRTAHLGQAAQPSFSQASIVLVRNDSGTNQNRMAVLGVDVPIIDPSANEDEFKNRVALSCVTPAADEHEGKFVILAEPIATGKIGRAFAAGVCPVKIDVPDEDYPYRLAEITDGSAANLTAAKVGSAAILWRAGGTGVQWALVRLGVLPAPTVLPVNLVQTGGSQGTTTAPASWTYRVVDPVTNEDLATNVNPVNSPHKWKRPSAGWMIPATFGYAHFDTDDQLVLGWINEMVEQEACNS